MAASRVVKLRLRGADHDNGDLRLSDFIGQLEDFMGALKATDKAYNGAETLEYLVVNLSHNSPAEVTAEAFPKEGVTTDPKETVGFAVDSIVAIQEDRPVSDRLDYESLKALKRVATRHKERITEVRISLNGTTVEIQPDFDRKVEQVIGGTYHAFGSLNGKILGVNINDKRVFTIYPAAGPKSVLCGFKADDLEKVRSILGGRAAVTGRMTYRTRSPFPVYMSATTIEPIVPSKVTLSDLAGIAPDATGKLSSEDFVRQLRLG